MRPDKLHMIPAVVECAEEYLLPIEASAWHEDDVPLDQRGVRFSWLYDFVAKVWTKLDAFTAREWAQHRSTEKAAMYGPWDIPWPEQPAYPEDLVENLRTTRQLVSNLIVPLTRPLNAPLYARVPPEHRGRPSVFISHTWSSSAVAAAHGSLDIVLDHHRDAFVWIDIACYNQHSVKDESIAADMKALIAGIGHIAFILTTQPFFTRSWCLWEIVCGHQTGADVKVHDQITRIKKKYWSSEIGQMPPQFNSVTELSATQRSDQEKILELLLLTFGSVGKANEYIRSILPREW
jgi:hypothetical protein